MAAKATALADEEPSPRRAIDVEARLFTTMLCMNQIITEKGISRIITGHLKDFMAGDVVERLGAVICKLSTQSVEGYAESNEKLLHELVGYMQYYLNNPHVVDACFDALICIAASNQGLRPTMAVHVLEVVTAATRADRERLAESFVRFCYALIRSGPDETNLDMQVEWRCRLIDRTFDAGLATVILSTATDSEKLDRIYRSIACRLTISIYLNLVGRSASEHQSLAQALRDAHETLGTVIAEEIEREQHEANAGE